MILYTLGHKHEGRTVGSLGQVEACLKERVGETMLATVLELVGVSGVVVGHQLDGPVIPHQEQPFTKHLNVEEHINQHWHIKAY